jgi:hypothetical protein
MKHDELPQPAPVAGKRPYASPVVSRVELRPEEAVLGNCKSTTASGVGNSRCRVFPIPPCSSIGS